MIIVKFLMTKKSLLSDTELKIKLVGQRKVGRPTSSKAIFILKIIFFQKKKHKTKQMEIVGLKLNILHRFAFAYFWT